MFSPTFPTILRANTAGTYLISLLSSTNLDVTNTSHKAEIIIGSAASSTETGTGLSGQQPGSPLPQQVMAQLAVNDTISVLITVNGVGNGTTFPLLSAALISYGV
jgi:hypothetical protein